MDRQTSTWKKKERSPVLDSSTILLFLFTPWLYLHHIPLHSLWGGWLSCRGGVSAGWAWGEGALRLHFSSTACNEWKDWPGFAAAWAHIDPVLLHTIVHHLTTVVLEQPRGPPLTSPSSIHTPAHVTLSQKPTMSLHLKSAVWKNQAAQWMTK